MTTAARDAADWRLRAACRGQDTEQWFGQIHEIGAALAICARCPVRDMCLYECMREEVPSYRYGVRGGLTAADRRRLPEGQEMTIAAFRRLLDEIDEQGGPEAARHNRLHLPDDEGTQQPMSTAPAHPVVDVQLKASADVRLKTVPADPEPIPVGQLLKWGDEHPDTEVRDQAARVRAGLTGLRNRHAADQELTAITTEAEQLEKRLAELRAREAELAPAKPKKARKPVDYPAAEVRVWAKENGLDCPAIGRVPKAIVDAWRAAQEPK
ncbi:Lsr2 protein [Streptomyces sp. cf386]|uniref:WhiB family transcriptional regulator n=1 Tax=Streptomyces sp. cf386 TaxID=1761904 RepID=UPI00088630FB|nr:WhiB family transcriptional regulator [Streptomyces sp. cf386]SDM47189.1 Lsr2 protein [Streptomyces sp. cf386]